MGKAKRKLTKGQPAGRRSASGRIRDRQPRITPPNDGIIRRRAIYGAPADDRETYDAIGRAWIAGLLNPNPERAKELLDAGRKIAAQYWRVYGFLTPDSLARFQPQSPIGPLDPDKERIREDALNDALSLIAKRGRDVRRGFDQLVIDINPDHGPPWLDAIIFAHRRQQRASERDYAMMALAIEGLDQVA